MIIKYEEEGRTKTVIPTPEYLSRFESEQEALEALAKKRVPEGINYEIVSEAPPDPISEKRRVARMDAEELELRLNNMGLLDDVDSLKASSKRWEIRWRRNSTFSRMDEDLIAGAKQLWPDSYESKLDELFSIGD